MATSKYNEPIERRTSERISQRPWAAASYMNPICESKAQDLWGCTCRYRSRQEPPGPQPNLGASALFVEFLAVLW